MRIDRSAVAAAGGVILLNALALSISLLLGSGAIPLCLLSIAFCTWRYGVAVGLATIPVSMGTVALFTYLRPAAWYPSGTMAGRVAVALVAALLLVWMLHTVRAALARARDAEQHIRNILDSMKDPFVAVDADWRISYLNPVAASLAGRSPPDLAGRNIWSLYPDYERSEAYQSCRRAKVERVPVHFETLGPARRWFVCDVYPAQDGVFAFAKDITERKLAEEAFRDKEAQMRIITDALPALIAYVDADLEYRFNNRAFEEWFGLASDEIQGRKVADFYDADEFALLRPHIDRVLAGETVSFVGEFTFKESKRFVNSVLVPDADEAGKVKGYFSLTTDITERKAAEKKIETGAILLRESERRFRAIFDQAAIGMAEIDLNGRFLQVNQKYCDIFGHTSRELRQLTLIDLSLPEDRLADALQFGRMAAGQFSSYSGERRRIRKDGSVVWTNIAMSIVKDDDGNPQFAVMVVEDISDRKALEEGLAQQANELARSNAELEQFAYAASHDLKEPLRTIGTYTDLILAKWGPKLEENERPYFTNIREAVGRMNGLIQDLLTYSRVGQSESRPLTRLGLEPVLRWAIMNLDHQIRETGAEVTFSELPEVLGDETQLSQLFQNLIGNAVKYRSADPPRIRITAERKSEQWVISVEDNGIGIEPQYFDRIFGVFKRLHGREYPGTGIGLAICKKIVRRHGGRIWVESQFGKGSTFRFTLQG